MISFLRGIVFSKNGQELVMDVNGVGYLLKMPSLSIGTIGPIGSEATVLVSMQVKEDGISLFGFADEDERFVFEKLITVSSVGPKAALAALSTYDARQLMAIIGAGDATAIAKVSGIGKKIAQRIAVDLKGCFEKYSQDTLLSEEGSVAAATAGEAETEAMQALLAMGFTEEEGSLALGGYTGSEDVQEIVRYALKRLGGFGR